MRAEKSNGANSNRNLENSIRFSPEALTAELDGRPPVFTATTTAPLAAGAKINSPAPAESNGKSESAKKIYRILIADDHEALRRGLRSALLGAGWQVVGEAADGKQAIEKTGELKPDLVLLDLSMPVMSGHEAAREILRVNPEIKIVVFTMHESQQVRDALSKIGVHALAVKSAPLSLLLDTIENVLTT
jgi:CheY-like chemotaxis protein